MSMFNTGDILETIEMFTQDNLDVRTVTMGISLLDCIDPDPKKACENIYNKITTKAANLVPAVEHISAEYGIPIINKRISVTPIAMLLGACPEADPVDFAKTLDAAGKKVGVNFVGGYSALVHKGFSAGDRRLIESIPRALAETDIVCSSVNIGATKAGLNMDAIKLMGEAVKKASELTADRQCIGAAKLVVFCNAPEDNPFMAGAFHGPGEPDCEIHVGVSGPGAVRAALARLPKDAPIDQVAELVKRTAFKITRVGQLVANLASEALGVPAGIIDLSLAPTPAVGDSVANILEEMGLETCGCCGTTACLALLNDAVKKGGVMASNHVGGLSGAFIPVSEDAGMIHAAEIGCLTIEKLEAMTAVCSVGIDMVIIPGDTTPAVISALIADEAAIGMVNSKTTAVRVIPAIGRKAGEVLDFGGLLGYGPIMPVNSHDQPRRPPAGSHAVAEELSPLRHLAHARSSCINHLLQAHPLDIISRRRVCFLWVRCFPGGRCSTCASALRSDFCCAACGGRRPGAAPNCTPAMRYVPIPCGCTSALPAMPWPTRAPSSGYGTPCWPVWTLPVPPGTRPTPAAGRPGTCSLCSSPPGTRWPGAG